MFKTQKVGSNQLVLFFKGYGTLHLSFSQLWPFSGSRKLVERLQTFHFPKNNLLVEVDNSTKWFEHFWNLKSIQRAEFVKEKGLLKNFRILQISEKINSPWKDQLIKSLFFYQFYVKLDFLGDFFSSISSEKSFFQHDIAIFSSFQLLKISKMC